jgi:hypothetical protein
MPRPTLANGAAGPEGPPVCFKLKQDRLPGNETLNLLQLLRGLRSQMIFASLYEARQAMPSLWSYTETFFLAL